VCSACNKSYISASGLRTHWKTTACTPTAEEEAFTAERSILYLQQSDPLLQQFKLEQVEEDEEEEEEDVHHQDNVLRDEDGGLVMDIDRSPRGWSERSESPPGRVRVTPADHLELADTVLNNGPTIDISTEDMRGHSVHGDQGLDLHETRNISCS
jgi:hypothetical protein